MTENKKALAKELADELDSMLTEKIVSMHKLTLDDPGWVLARQWNVMFRQKLYALMDATGISRVR